SITPLAGGGFAVNGSHAYAEDGTYTVTVSIHDAVDNTTATNTTTATVRENDLTSTGVPVVGNEGKALTNVTLPNFSDPGSAAPPPRPSPPRSPGATARPLPVLSAARTVAIPSPARTRMPTRASTTSRRSSQSRQPPGRPSPPRRTPRPRSANPTPSPTARSR